MSLLGRIICFVFLLSVIAEGQLQCGFPGQPKNGTVNIAFDSSMAVAKYECPRSFIIDGDVERTCRDDGTWTGTIPRCATEASVKKSLGHEKRADGNLETCDWIHEGNAIVLEFEKKFQMYSIKMICPAPYKDSLKEAEIDVQGLDRDRVTGTGVHRTFHEKDSILDNNNFSSVQWRLNISEAAVRVGLIKGSAYICEIKVLTIPEECGRVEEPRNGRIEYDKSSALCRCDPNFQVEGDFSVRMCSDGRWTGEQCECRLIDTEGTQMYVITTIIINILSIIIVILFFVIIRSRMQRRLLNVKKQPQMQYQASTKSSNEQQDEDDEDFGTVIQRPLKHLLPQPKANEEIFCSRNESIKNPISPVQKMDTQSHESLCSGVRHHPNRFSINDIDFYPESSPIEKVPKCSLDEEKEPQLQFMATSENSNVLLDELQKMDPQSYESSCPGVRHHPNSSRPLST